MQTAAMSVLKVDVPIQLVLIHAVKFPQAAVQVILVHLEVGLNMVTHHTQVAPNAASDESQTPPIMTEIMIVTMALRLVVQNIVMADSVHST